MFKWLNEQQYIWKIHGLYLYVHVFLGFFQDIKRTLNLTNNLIQKFLWGLREETIGELVIDKYSKYMYINIRIEDKHECLSKKNGK